MSNLIHPSAIIHPNAILGENVKIGPYCIIGEEVNLGNNVEIKSHIVIEGRTSIGDYSIIYPFASIGQIPQDLKYNGESSTLKIGKNNTIREYVTIQPGTKGGGMETIVGDNNLFMVGVHIAHDCIIGSNVIFANYVNLAGHVKVGDFVRMGGLSAVAQYVRIGEYSMIGGLSGVGKDLIPFGLASNERATLDGLNLIGMKRRGFENQHTLECIEVIKEIFSHEGIFNEKIDNMENKYNNNPIIVKIIKFLKEDLNRSFCQLKKTK